MLATREPKSQNILDFCFNLEMDKHAVFLTSVKTTAIADHEGAKEPEIQKKTFYVFCDWNFHVYDVVTCNISNWELIK